MTDYAKEEQHILEYDKFVFGGLKCDCESEKDLLKCPSCLRKRKEAALKEASKDYAATVARQTEIFKLLWANNIVFLGAFGYLLLNRNEMTTLLAFFVALGAFVHTTVIEGVYQSALDLSKIWMSHIYHLENSIFGRLNKTKTFTEYVPQEVNYTDHRARKNSGLTVEKLFLLIYGAAMLISMIVYFLDNWGTEYAWMVIGVMVVFFVFAVSCYFKSPLSLIFRLIFRKKTPKEFDYRRAVKWYDEV